MKIFYKITTIFLCQVITSQTWANINAIDFNKIRVPGQDQKLITYLRDNVGMYDHWSPQWNYNVKKETVTGNLIALMTDLSKQDNKTADEYLLMGDISHFLYNMNLDPYFDKAVTNYNSAIKFMPNDYRGYWFLANHYALSNDPIKAITNYNFSLKLLPGNPSGYFWAEYAFSAFLANMPSTAQYAADKSLKLLGRADKRTETLIDQLKRNLKQPKPDTTLGIKEIWSSSKNEGDGTVTFINRVIGARLAINGNWGIQLGDFGNYGEGITISPQRIVSKVDNEAIGYSIAVIAKVPQTGQSLSDFISIFCKKGEVLKPVNLTRKYDKSIAYEIIDKSIYQDIGGGHMYMIAIERDEPAYPGIAFEQASGNFSNGEVGKVNYYTAQPQFTRLKGKLYYLVLLDSCEYIHDESLAVFKDFLEKGLLIE